MKYYFVFCMNVRIRIVFIISSQKFKPFFKILKSTKICNIPCRKCTTTGDIYLLVLNCNIIAFEITMVNAQLLVPSTLQNILTFVWLCN